MDWVPRLSPQGEGRKEGGLCTGHHVLDPGRVAVTEAVSLGAMRLPASPSSIL